MPKTAENITRFRKNLKQFLSLKEAGKLNGQAAVIEQKLKDSAEIAGLDFDEELKGAQGNPRKNAENKFKEGGKVKMFTDEPPLFVKKINQFPNHVTYDLKSKDGKIDRRNIVERLIYQWDEEIPQKRQNPLKLPFTITLKQLDKLHSIRSAKKLNRYVGHKHECYASAKGNVNSHLAFRYTPDYRNKKYTLDLLLDGKLTHTACASGEKASFVDAWKEIVEKYGDLEIEIRNQKHAKKVLGAREYRRQEKALEEKPKPTPKRKSDLKEKILKEFEKEGIKTTGVNEKLPETVENAIQHVNDLGYESWEKSTIMGPKIKDIVKRLSNESGPTKTYKDFPIGTHVKFVGLPETVNGKPNPLIGKTGVVTHSQHLDVDVEIKGYGTSGFKPENLEKIDTPVQAKEEKSGEEPKETYSPTFSQLAVFLAFQRAHEYDHENKLNRIENYQRKFLLGKKDKLYIKETWHNREFDEDHTRWHEISKAGKYDTIYSSNFPDEKNLKPVQVDETIDVPKSKMKLAYDLNNYDKDNYKNRQQINRAVLLREIILGKMEAARYKGFDGMTDSTRYVPKDEIEWFDPAKDGWFWSRMFRNFTTPKAYNSPNHWNPGVITFDDFEFRYKGSDAGRGGKKKELEAKPDSKETLFIQGNETKVDFKADGTISEPAFYALVEAKDIVASHNKDCTPNSKHSISKAQPRDRSLDALCAQPKFIAKNLNPSSITEGNLAFNGTPVTTVMLQAVQGNGRTIAIKIAYDEVPKKAAEYKEYLEKNASKFGFTKKQVQSLNQPVLIRVLDVTESRAVELGNVVDTSQAKMNKIDAAKAYVRNLPEAKRKIIGDIINDSSGETLGEVIDDKGLKIFDQFKDLDRSDLVANNALTSEGKDFLRSVFAGLVFDSEDRKEALQAFLSLPHQIKAGLERSYGHLIPFVGTKADITPEVRGAVMIVDALNKRDGIETVDELFQSVDAFEGSFADKFSLREKALAKFLVDTSTQKEIRNAFRMYQYFITGKEDLFNPIKKTTPDIAFRLAFIEKHRMNPVDQLDKETQIHKLIVRIQRLENFKNDHSKEREKLNKLIGEDGWKWNNGRTKIIRVRENKCNSSNPSKSARFIFLGIMDSMKIDQSGKLVELQGPHALFTNKKKDKIYVAPFDLIKEFPSTIRDKKAEEIFKEWNNYSPDHKDLLITWPTEKDLPVGSAHDIHYISDKVLREGDRKGKMNVYHHEFDRGKRPAAKKGNVLIVGNLEIDERGILN